MGTRSIGTMVQRLRKTLSLHSDTIPTDAELLQHFIEHRDEAAFAALVRRHGSMIMGVCLRVACNPHDAEDAFQATLLILVRKAAAIARRELLANWLHGVAYLTALKARAAARKRQAREKQFVELPEPAAIEPNAGSAELRALLDRELTRLPEKYRVPVILCDLEGKTRREAAQLLGCPEGSLSSRLARARTLLARRLARHGLTVAAGSLAVLAQQNASACVPPTVTSSIFCSVTRAAAGQATSGTSPQAAALAKGVLRAMLLTKFKTSLRALVVALSLMVVVGSAYSALIAGRTDGNTPPRQQASASPDKKSNRSQGSSSAQNDRAKLQGSWRLVTCIQDGRVVPIDLVKQIQIDFRGDRMKLTPPLEIHERQVEGQKEKHVAFHIGEGSFEVVYRLDPASRPKGIELTDGIMPGQVVKGIYSLEGDRLRICVGLADRATDFTSKPGSKQSLFVLQRQKSATNTPGKDARATETEKLQGAWRLVKVERHGLTWQMNDNGDLVRQDNTPTAFPIDPEVPWLVTFSGQRCVQEYKRAADSNQVLRGTYRLDASRRPQWITLSRQGAADVCGIYSLQQDELRICWQFGQRRDQRPADFDTKRGSDRGEDAEVWILKRRKK